MAIGNDRFDIGRTGAGPDSRAEAGSIDAGLRSYMLKVYNYMTSGLLLTGVIAMLTASSTGMMQAIYGTPLQWVVMLAPLGFIFALSLGVHKFSLGTLHILFWAFAGAMGVSLSYIFVAYTGTSIARVFFITAGTFAAMSLYGYTTKKDLSAWGSFLFMGLIGIILASVVNIFLQSSAMQFVISVIGVLVFTGLTAYDTQRIKAIYNELDSSDIAGKKAIMGALTLYLDFINLFVMLLQLLGNRE